MKKNDKIYSKWNYVFTSDNFIKLIIIRLRAKTSLVRIINDLKEKYIGLDEGMLILNIHCRLKYYWLDV